MHEKTGRSLTYCFLTPGAALQSRPWSWSLPDLPYKCSHASFADPTLLCWLNFLTWLLVCLITADFPDDHWTIWLTLVTILRPHLLFLLWHFVGVLIAPAHHSSSQLSSWKSGHSCCFLTEGRSGGKIKIKSSPYFRTEYNLLTVVYLRWHILTYLCMHSKLKRRMLSEIFQLLF